MEEVENQSCFHGILASIVQQQHDIVQFSGKASARTVSIRKMLTLCLPVFLSFNFRKSKREDRIQPQDVDPLSSPVLSFGCGCGMSCQGGVDRGGGKCRFVVVGDAKGPHKYDIGLTTRIPMTFTIVNDQRELSAISPLVRMLPRNHFGRKNIGYVLAIV